MTTEHLKRAESILAEMRHLRATQCRNCGLVFHNVSGTHDLRGLFRRPSCRYDAIGWEDALTEENEGYEVEHPRSRWIRLGASDIASVEGVGRSVNELHPHLELDALTESSVLSPRSVVEDSDDS